MIFELAIGLVLVLALLAAATALGVAAIEKRYPPAGRFVPVSGGRLHVLELGEPGDTPPVVLLHGASGNLQDMRLTLGEKLAERHRVILIDRPGHGWSDRPGGADDAEPARQAALVAQALTHLGAERAILVGHSWSGALATAFALAYPRRVAGLVLLAPVTHPWKGGVTWYYGVASMRSLGPLFARTVVLPHGLPFLAGLSRGVFAPQPIVADYVRRAAIPLILRPAVFMANALDVCRLNANVARQAPRYAEITARTVIITGDRDGVVSPALHAKALATQVPHAKLITLPGVGHAVQHVAADAAVAEIDRLAGL
jgi:pimeloyl-ACP methyl ester carboxylesterase